VTDFQPKSQFCSLFDLAQIVWKGLPENFSLSILTFTMRSSTGEVVLLQGLVRLRYAPWKMALNGYFVMKNVRPGYFFMKWLFFYDLAIFSMRCLFFYKMAFLNETDILYIKKCLGDVIKPLMFKLLRELEPFCIIPTFQWASSCIIYCACNK
jgi:hypothetical protein